MTLLALSIKAHTGIRLAELGFLAGAIGSVLLMLGGSKRWAIPYGGLALAIGFVLLIVATRWGHFH
jgi:hypothetical protein